MAFEGECSLPALETSCFLYCSSNSRTCRILRDNLHTVVDRLYLFSLVILEKEGER